MLQNSLSIVLFSTLLGCINQNGTQTHNLQPDASSVIVGVHSADTTQIKVVEASTADTAELTFQQFQDTKWIVGEVGVNGEQTDTIIFAKPDTLTYISTDTGRELCKYYFKKDTLVYYSRSIEADMNSFDDLTCNWMTKLHYERETLKYVYSEKKCTGDKETKRYRMDTLDVRFRKL